LAVTNGGQFDEKTTGLVEKALKLDQNHPKALLLAGTIAFKNADYKKAIGIWEHLQPLIAKDDVALAQDIANNIAEAKSLSGKK
jgi:cytochrome c-type biogenesis protein CcmH